jgi:hypothetical protein
MSYFKKEERTASTKQIEKLAETFIGILNSQKKLDIDMTDKPTKADAVSMTVGCIRDWENESAAELGDAFKFLTMADISTFFDMSYRRKGVWCYEEDASVIALVEEKMLEKFSGFKVETLEASKPKETKKKKTAKKQPVTLKVSEPVEKPIDELKAWNPAVAIKIDDETREFAARIGISATEAAQFSHLLAKDNS